jgi:hypothetical protein
VQPDDAVAHVQGSEVFNDDQASKMWARADTPAWYRGEVSRATRMSVSIDIASSGSSPSPAVRRHRGTAVNFRQPAWDHHPQVSCSSSLSASRCAVCSLKTKVMGDH